MVKKINLIGSRFGILTVVGEVPAHPRRKWRCKCDCGGESILDTAPLRNGNTKSCGCISPFRFKHGMTGTKLEVKYNDMKRRCTSSNADSYKYYGGRGIVICDEWMSNPSSFYEWANNNNYKDGLELDRIDPDGDYTPDNCRFITHTEQMRNTRRSKSGITALARKHGINPISVFARLYRGWSIDQAISVPINTKHRRRSI